MRVELSTLKDKAVDSILGADAFFCVTARRHDAEHVEVVVYTSGDEKMVPAMVDEMLHYSRFMLFGEREEEVEDDEVGNDNG